MHRQMRSQDRGPYSGSWRKSAGIALLVLAMVLILDTTVFLQFDAAMMLPQDTDLESLTGKRMFDQVVTNMDDYGMPEPVVRRLKPWVVIAILSMPKPQGGLALDMVLYQHAQRMGKPVSGLESAREQIAPHLKNSAFRTR